MKIIVYDVKPYDQEWFEKINQNRHQIKYVSDNLTSKNITLSKGYEAICGFVNTDGSKEVLKELSALGVKYWLARSMGYDAIDLKAAEQFNIKVFRVPNYSAEAVAEHAVTLLMTLNRHIYESVSRTKKWNFALAGLEGKVINNSTVGVIGAGKIGQSFIKIMRGMGAKVIVFDEYAHKNIPTLEKDFNFTFVSLEEIMKESDFISLHAPLLPSTEHIINAKMIDLMTKKPLLINCSRGKLIDTSALIAGLQKGKIGGAGLDVLERESNRFYYDLSSQKNKLEKEDAEWKTLLANERVLITSHQAFLTDYALKQIATITLENATKAQQGDFTNALTILTNGKIKNG